MELEKLIQNNVKYHSNTFYIDFHFEVILSWDVKVNTIAY